MGAGIAHVSVEKGYKVVLKDTNNSGLYRGVGQIQTGLSTAVKKKKITRYFQYLKNFFYIFILIFIFIGLVLRKMFFFQIYYRHWIMQNSKKLIVLLKLFLKI